MLQPIEKGQVAYRHMQGLPPKYHSRLKHSGRTLCTLQGDTQAEANARAWRLADALLPGDPGVTVEVAS